MILCFGEMASDADGAPPSSLATGNANREILLRRIASVRGQVRSLEMKIAELRQRVPAVQQELEDLTERIGAIKLPDPDPGDPPDEPGPQQVPYRPPFARVEVKETPIVIVCQENSVSIVDFEEFHTELEKAVEDESQIQSLVKNGGQFSAGDFEIKIQFIVVGRDVMTVQEAERKPGTFGEPVGLATRPGSKLQTRLNTLVGEKSVIQFAVYPDSYDAFRRVREIVWKGKFSVNWIPLKHGEALPIGSGSGGVTVQ